MHKLITFSAASALSVLTALPAAATVTKTWVSSTGTDSGTCQLVAPCKTFQFAHDQTSPSGEIDVKDSGSYGPVTITKAISITAGGNVATVGASADAAITVTAGAGDIVVLQGLVIDGHGIGLYGVSLTSAKSITVDHCVIRNFTTAGISLNNTSIFAMITNNLITGSYYGVSVSQIGFGIIGGNTITANYFGVSTSQTIYSYGDNHVNGNYLADTSGVINSAKTE